MIAIGSLQNKSSFNHEKISNLGEIEFTLETIIYNKEEKVEVRIAAEIVQLHIC